MNPWLQQLAQHFQRARHMRGGRGMGGGDMGPGMGGRQWGQLGGWGGGAPPQAIPAMPQRPMMQTPPQGEQGPQMGPGGGIMLPNGWMQRMAAGGTAMPGQALPTEQVKMGANYDGPDNEPDSDPDDRRRRGY